MSAKELTIPEMQKAITEYKGELENLKTSFNSGLQRQSRRQKTRIIPSILE